MNKTFNELCNSNELWRKICVNNGVTLDDDISDLASDIGYKKVFFSNKGPGFFKNIFKRRKIQIPLESVGENLPFEAKKIN